MLRYHSEEGVIKPFAELWGTDELLVSFDGVNITLPGRKDMKWKPWPHVDQAPTRKGLACAQGIINLSEAGPLDGGLQLLQGSSELFEQFFREHPPQPKAADAPGQFDWPGFSLSDIKWFEDHGCKLIKVNGEPGDVIIWDSRTKHYASLPQSETIRTIIYATFFFVGAILSSWSAFGTFKVSTSTWTWRIPSLLQLALPLIQFVTLFWVPESPRWLVSKGRSEEARAVLVKYHAGGDENSPLVNHELQEITDHLLVESEVAAMGWPKVG
jgi:hypothetical protein